jgi:hypothetical protein
MKRSDIEVGRVYLIRHDGKPTPVRVDAIKPVHSHSHRSLYGGTTRYHFLCLNSRTNRLVEVKSAQRFQCELTLVDGKWMSLPNF